MIVHDFLTVFFPEVKIGLEFLPFLIFWHCLNDALDSNFKTIRVDILIPFRNQRRDKRGRFSFSQGFRRFMKITTKRR